MTGVAVIGAGHWGPHLIRNFHDRPGSEVVWVVDRDPARLAAVRERFPAISVGADAADALADERVHAVVVATPSSTHHRFALDAIARGKHVLVEKPLATTAADAQQVCDAARDAGVVLMVGHVFLFNAGVRTVKDYLDAGKLGRLHYISMVRTNLGPIRTDVDAAWDLAAHDVSIVNHWLGAGPDRVSAVGGSWINEGISDAVFATLEYPGGVLVNLHVSWLNPRKTRDITLVGSDRMLVLDDMNLTEPLRVYDKGVAEPPEFADTFTGFRASIREGDVTIPRVPLSEPLAAECAHFLECIGTGAAPLSGGEDGLAVVRTLEAIERSARAGGAAAEVGA